MTRALLLLSCLVVAGCTSPCPKVVAGLDHTPVDLSGTYNFDARDSSGDVAGANCLFLGSSPLKDHSQVVISQEEHALPCVRYTDQYDRAGTDDLDLWGRPYCAWQDGALIYGMKEWEVAYIPAWVLRCKRTGGMALDDTGDLVVNAYFLKAWWFLFVIPYGSEEHHCGFVLKRVR